MAGGLVWYVFVVGLVLRLIYASLNPTYRAPDEKAHVEYIVHLAREVTLPRLPPPIPNQFPGSENNQPPLYYALLTPIYSIATWFRLNESEVVITLRIASICLFWVPSYWLGWLAVYNIPVAGWYLWGSIVILGLLPGYLALTASVNNDQALFLGSIAVLYLITRQKPSFLGIGIVLGLACLTKLSAVLIGIALTAFWCYQLLNNQPLKAIIKQAWPAAVFGGGAVLAWMARSSWVYGDATRAWVFYEKYAANRTSLWEGLYEAQSMLKATFWATAGQFNDLHFLPKFHLFLTYSSVIGTIIFIIKQKLYQIARLKQRIKTNPVLSAWITAALINIVIVLQHGYAYYMSQGRYLYPMILPVFWSIFTGWDTLARLTWKNSLKVPGKVVGWFLALVWSMLSALFILFLLDTQ